MTDSTSNDGLAAMTPSQFVAHVRGIGINAMCEKIGSKRGSGISRTRQIGNLCEHIFGKARRNEYVSEFFGG